MCSICGGVGKSGTSGCVSLCLSDETLPFVGPFYLVSMPGGVDKIIPVCTGNVYNLSWTPHSSLEKDNSLNNS